MLRGRRVWMCGLAALLCLAGCDGKDPDRLARVGKKLAEKGQKAAEDAKLPKVTVTYPDAEEKKTKE